MGGSTTRCSGSSVADARVGALAIHPGALGDVLLAIPALRALRAEAPVVLAAQPRIGALLAALGVVDGHEPVERLGLEPLFVDEPCTEPVPRLSAASRVVCWFGARDPVFARRMAQVAPGAVVASSSGDGRRDVWEHLVSTVGGDGRASREPVALPASLREAGRQALVRAGWDGATPLLALHPGAGGAAKQWPAKGFARAVESALGARGVGLVIHRGPADRAAADALAAALGRRAMVLEDPPLETLAGALGHAAAWLGNDSGPSHLAAAVGARALVLFRRDNLAWRPWSPTARALTVDVSRASATDVETVASALRRLLESG